MRSLLSVILLAVGLAFSIGSNRTHEDMEVSLRRLRDSADAGNPEALYRLAMLYDSGYDSISPDTIRSTMLYRLAAEAGHTDAQNYLGYRLYRGDGVPRDIPAALQWLENSAIAGNPRAAGNLGFLLLYGDGVEHDPANAAFWLQRAADEGVTTALSMLGDLYLEGSGVPQDSVHAAALYRQAFESGLADAAYKLEYMNRVDWDGLSPEQKVEQGLCFYTRGVPAVAIPLFESAADAGNPHALALLGDAHTRAMGVAYDHQKALDFYARSAAAGYPPAMFIIGELLEIFPDAFATLSPDVRPLFEDAPADAQYWLQKARNAGISDAAAANRSLLFP